MKKRVNRYTAVVLSLAMVTTSLVLGVTPAGATAGTLTYVSGSSNGTIDGITYADEDILSYDFDSDTWAMYIDGSDVGLNGAGQDLDALHVDAAGDVWFSLQEADSLTGIGAVTDGDIIKLTVATSGTTTTGTFSLEFDVSTLGLSTTGEDVDAVAFNGAGDLLVSTRGSYSVTGLSGTDEDVIRWDGATWSLHVDGSAAGFAASSEDINAVSISPTDDVYLSTAGAYTIPGLTGDDDDVILCAPTSTNPIASCTSTVSFDGNSGQVGWGMENVDGTTIVQSTPSNNAPVAADDSESTVEDIAVIIDVVANDADADGNLDPASTNNTCANGSVGCSAPSDGSVVNNGDGTFLYTPDSGFTGSDSFVYEICDLDVACDTATVSITVQVNQPPTAFSDNAATSIGNVVSIDVAANDTDPTNDLDPTTTNTTCANGSVGCATPSNGTLTNNADGTFVYSPNGTFTGADSFVYEICDLGGSCDTAVVSITVSADRFIFLSTGSNGTVGGVTYTDEDVLVLDTSTGIWEMFIDGSDIGMGSGEAQINALHVLDDGSVLFSHGATAPLSFPGVPVADEHDIVRFIPTSIGDVTAGTFELYFDGDLFGVSQVLEEDIDSITFDPSGDLVFSVRGPFNAGGVTGFDEDLFSFDGTNFALHTDGSAAGFESSEGGVSQDVDGASIDSNGTLNVSFRFPPLLPGPLSGNRADIIACVPSGTPVTSCSSSSITFAGSGAPHNISTLDGIAIYPNDPRNVTPDANDDFANTPLDTAIILDVSANDTDTNLDATTANTTCINGSTGCATPTNGSVVDNGNGTITYTPDTGFVGIDSFVYEICDTAGLCATATVSMTIGSSNTPPLAVDDSAIVPGSGATAIDVTANDSDPQGDLDITTAAPGCAGCAPSVGGTAVGNGDGTISFTPTPGFSGIGSFDYEVCDLGALCSIATVTVNVMFVSTVQNTINSSSWAAPSTDTSGVVYLPMQNRLLAVDGPVNRGPFYQNVNMFASTLAGQQDATYTTGDFDGGTVEPTGVTYSDATGSLFVAEDFPFNGEAVFETLPGPDGMLFTADDTYATLLTRPLGSPDPEGITFDSDSGTLFIADGASNLVLEIFLGADMHIGGGDDVVVSTFDTAALGVTDPEGIVYNQYTGTLLLAGETVTIGSETYDTVVEVTRSGVLVRYLDVSDLLTVPSLQRLSGLGIGPSSSNPNGRSLYIADRGEGIDSNAVQNDGRIYEMLLPTLPTASPDAVSDVVVTAVDVPLVVQVAANDSDVNGNLLISSANATCSNGSTGCAGAANGTLVSNGDGTITYTPNIGYIGLDTFVYEICDFATMCATATVFITVTGANNAPVAVDDTVSMPESTTEIIDVAANDTDVDSNLDPTAVSITCPGCSTPTDGSAVVNPAGTVSYTPDVGFIGSDSFVYEICDSLGLCDTATVSISVNDIPEAPVPGADAIRVFAGQVRDIDVSANDTDGDGDLDPTSVNTTCANGSTGCSAPSSGVLTNNGDGSFTYTAASGFFGSADFTYEICDLASSCVTQTVDVRVLPNQTVYISTSGGGTVGGVVYADEDILAFDSGTSTWSMYFDGSDVGMTGNNVDGFAVLGNGDVLLTVAENGTLPDVGAITEADVVMFAVATSGDTTTGTYSMYFDGSTIALTSGGEDLDAVTITQDGSLAISTRGFLNSNGFFAQDEDLVDINGVSPSLYLDGSQLDLLAAGEDVDAGFVYGNDVYLSTLDPFDVGGFTGDDGDVFVCVPTNAALPIGSCTFAEFWVEGDPVHGLGSSDLDGFSLISISPPIAVDDVATVANGNSVLIDVLVNDSDADGNMVIASTNVVCVGCETTTDGTLVNNGDGTFTYTPDPGFFGIDTFVYEVCDDTALCGTATVTITLDNLGPTAVDDAVNTPVDTLIVIDVLANDTDPEGNFDAAATTITVAPTSGTAINNGDGTVDYTPNPGSFATDTFTYEMCDTGALCDTAVVTITVDNTAPVAVDDSTLTQPITLVNIDILANDTDAENNIDVATLSITIAPTGGTATILVDDTVDYTPDAGFFATDTFTYEICDTGGLCDSAVVSIAVDNAAPVAVDDLTNALQGELITVDVLANDTDTDFNIDSSTVTVTVQAVNGTATANPDGTISYVSGGGLVTADIFTYEVCDTGGLCDTATVAVIVTNTAPTAIDDTEAVTGETTNNLDVLANDTDPENNLDPAQVTITAAPVNGSAVPQPDGTIDYTPNAGFFNTEAFDYQVCDIGGLCDTATVTVTVDNTTPIAVDDTATTAENTLVAIDVVTNDTDTENNIDPTTVTIDTAPTNGVAVPGATPGTVDYTPNVGFFNTDTFIYQVCDFGGLCDTATVTVTVDNTNPVAVDDTASTGENTLVNVDVVANDTDTENNIDPSTVTIDTAPTNGTAVPGATPGTVDYTPNAGFFLTDTFVYQVCDLGGLCGTATVTVTIDNTEPVAVDDSATTAGATLVNIDVAVNDSDVDGNLDPTTITITTAPTNGTAVPGATPGTVDYTPNAGFFNTETFIYEICDTGDLCDTATVTVTVDNTVPDAIDDAATVFSGAATPIDVLTNDTDPESNIDPTMVTIDTAPTNGTAVPNIDGTVSYTPDVGFFLTDTFVYEVCDLGGLCDTATVTVTVDNTAPDAVDDAFVTPFETAITFDVLTNDLDADGNLDPASATVTITTTNGTAVDNGNGSVTYTPNTGFWLSDTLTYEVCDTGLLCDTAVATISIANNAPFAINDSATTTGATLVNIPVSGNDADVENNIDPTTVTIDTPPTSGTAVAGATPGTVDYTPDVGFFNIDSFVYEICDLGGLCDTATVTVTVDNTAPIAVDDSATTAGSTLVNIDVVTNDTDPENNIDPTTVTIDTAPTNGTAVPGATAGTVDYTPDAGFFLTDTFVYEVCDLGGLCDTATVTVTVDNTAPIAVDDSTTTAGSTLVNIDVVANDTDTENNIDPTTAVITVAPTNGLVGNNGDGTFDYTPTAGFFLTDTFTYEVCDLGGLCDTAIVSITVDNTAPIGVDDTTNTPENTLVNIDVVANDTDAENNIDPSTVTIDTPPTNGTAVLGATPGTVDYTPDAGFFLTDSFDYEVCDLGGLCDTATVTVTVDNTAPIAADDVANTAEGALVNVDVLTNDTDAQNNIDPTTVTIDTPATNGTAVVQPDNTISYTPDVGFFLTDTFVYEVCDTGLLCDTATVTVTVDNTAPIAVDDSATTAGSTLVNIDVATNDTDAENNIDPTTVTIDTPPTNGIATPGLTPGTVDYTPNAGFFLTDTFVYEICDTGLLCDTATVTVTVDNTAPIAVDDSATTAGSTLVNIDVVTNDTDAENNIDPTSITIDTPPTNGTATPGATPGTVDYTPNAGFFLTDTFVYEVCDLGGLCDTATVTVTVDNTAPIAADDVTNTAEGVLVNVDVLTNDTDAENNIDPTTVTIDAPPTNGTAVVQPDNTISYTPNAGFFLSDSFVYEVCDLGGLCDTAIVTVMIDNTAPIAVDDAATTAGATLVNIDVATNDTDAENNIDPTTVTIDSAPTNGTATPGATPGTVDYTPNAGFFLTDTFVYEICDTGLLCSTATVTVTVDNTAPVGVDDSATTAGSTLVNIDVATNDTDAENNIDPTSITIDTPPTNGTATPGATPGTVDYTPNAGFFNTDSFVYQICDLGGLCDTATVTITVDNTAPVGVDDSATTAGSTLVNIDVATNDTDAENNIDPTSITIDTPPTNGTATPGATPGTVDYTPNAGFFNTDTFVYEVCDLGGLCDTATVTVTVDNTNPVALDDTANTPENTLVNIDVVTNDTDAENNIDPTTVTIDTPPTNGTAVVQPDNTISYTPDVGFFLSDTFVYEVCDLGGLCDTATVTVTVDNTAPVAVDDSANTAENTLINIDVAGNDTDAEGNIDATTVAVTAAPTNGTATPGATPGTVDYTPDVGFFLTDTFVYEICDTGLLCSTATVTVTVDNTAPIAVDDSATTAGSTLVNIDVVTNDTDAENNIDPTSITIDTAPTNGTATPGATPGTVDYTPNAGFFLTDTFVYEICDTGLLCSTATVTVTVDNTAPVAVDDTANTPENTLVNIDVVTNDTDAENNIDPTTAVITAAPTNGLVGNNGDGTFDYTPVAGFFLSDTFSYEVCDLGGLCDTATVTITVDNTAPVGVDDSATTTEATLVNIDVATNDTDAENNIDPTTVTIDTAPTNGTATPGLTPGTVDYTPNAGFFNTDTFIYEICDTGLLCSTATVTVTVDNTAPVAVDDTANTPENTLVNIDVVVNDTDAENNIDPTTVTIDTPPTNGTAVVQPDNTVGYTPDVGFFLSDTFVYEVCDLGGLCGTATVTVTVDNTAPIAVDDNATTAGATLVNIGVAGNDTDAESNIDPTSITIDTAPTNGTATPGATPGTVDYTPDVGFFLTDTFVYEICDTGLLCDTATVTVTVDNTAPVAVDDTANTPENTFVNIDVVTNDTDAENNIDPTTVTIDTPPTNGTAVLGATPGTVDYTPNGGFFNTDTFVYAICDLGGLCDTATVTVTVDNTAPIAVDDAASTTENTLVSIDVATNDTDAENNIDPTTVTIDTAPTNGTAALGATPGTVDYTPNAGFFNTDSFVYEICDTGGLCDTATVTVTVDNTAPIAVDDNDTTAGATLVNIDVAANDTDAENNIDPTTVTIDTPPTNGTAVLGATPGTVDYTPDVGFFNTDTFVYEVCDLGGLCDTATVTITVDNTAPVGVDDTATTAGATLVNIDVAANDTDAENNIDPTTVTIDTPPTNGTAVLGATPGTVDYTPNGGFFNTDTFVYAICDLGGLCDTATVTITVDNTAPIAVDDTATTAENTLVNIDVVTNDTDAENNIDPTTATITVAPTNGLVGNNGDGTFDYTPVAGFFATDSFTYEVCDLGGLCDTAAVTITVDNTAPVGVDDSATTTEATLVNIDVVTNDTDAENNIDPTTVTIDTPPTNGTATPGATPGTVDYTPNAGFFLTDTFVYEVCDLGGLCDTATVTVTIDNTAPTAVDDAATTPGATLVNIDVATNDTDAENNIDPTTVTIDTAPTNGTATPGLTPGTVGYTPNAGFFNTDTFIYEICDTGLLCSTATVTVTVDNTAPTAVDDSATTAGATLVNIDVAANDTDPENNIDPTTVTIDTPPTNGTATPGATPGTVDYTPNAGFFNTDTFVYEICDTGGLCDTATVTITVDNTAPIAVDDTANTPENTLVNIDVVANDTDPENNIDPTTASITVAPTNGLVGNNGDGTFDYTPTAGFFATDSFEYEVCDLGGLCDTATATIMVTNVAPIANDDLIGTAEATLVVIDVAANDTDADNNIDPTSVTITTPPANGTFVNNNDGTVDYTPNAGFFLTDTFVYEICDTGALCDTATVSIAVGNTAPVANDDAAGTAEATLVNIDVATNDTDIDSNLDPASVTITTPPTNGTAAPGATAGTVDYTPNAGFFATDTFVYEICDTGSLCDTATVTVTIDNVGPTAVDDTATTAEDTLVNIDVADNDSDPNGNLDLGSITITGAATNGTATPGAAGTVDYTPNTGHTGTDTFTYQICDLDAACDTATVTVTTNAAPSIPSQFYTFENAVTLPGGPSVTSDDIVSYDPNTDTWTMYFDASDVGISGNNVDAFHVRSDGSILMSFDTTNTNVPGLTGGPSGTTVNRSDIVLFTPTTTGDTTAGAFSFYFDGSDVSLTTASENIAGIYEFDNGDLAISTRGNLNGPGLADTARNKDIVRFSGSYGATTTGSFTELFDGSDVDLRASSEIIDGITFVDGETDVLFVNRNGITVPGVTANDEDVTRFSGTFGASTSGTYTLEIDFSTVGVTTSISGISIANTTPPANVAPNAVDDAASTDEDTLVNIDVAANDVDSNLDLGSITITAGPTNGTATPGTAGTVDYTPNTGHTGTDTFTYQICDTEPLCDTATVTVTTDAAPVNMAPVANDDTASTTEETLVNIDVADNDTDVDNNLDLNSITITTQPTNGTATPGATPGTIDYTPNNGHTGTDTLTYQICDTEPLCDTATITITTNTVGAPLDGQFYSFEGAVSLPGGPSVISDDIVTYDANADTWAMYFDGSDVGISGNNVDAFHVRSDGSILMSFGTTSTNVAGLTGGPNGTTVNRSDIVLFTPTTTGDTTAGSFSFYFDGSDVLLTTASENIAGLYEFDNGDLAISTRGNINATGLTTTARNKDIIRYTGTYGSTTNGTFTQIFDGSDVGLGASSEILDGITFVDGETDVLLANRNGISVPGVTADDEDVTRFSGTFGTTTSGTYTVETDFSTLGVTQGLSGISIANTTPPANVAPNAVDDTATTDEDTLVNIDVAANDVDTNLDLTSITITVGATNGTAVPGAAGTVDYTPNNGHTGPDTFTYQICDTGALCDTATVTVTTTAAPINMAPVANNDTATTDEDTLVNIDAANNDTDVDNNLDLNSITITTQPTNGTATPGATPGTIDYTPNNGHTGTDTLTYQICDTEPLCDTATITITTTAAPVNQAPVANNDAATTDADVAVNIDVAANDTDVDNNLDLNSVTITAGPTNGTAVPGAAGTVDYTPNNGHSGPDTFTYQICDTEPLCDTATVTVTTNAGGPDVDAPTTTYTVPFANNAVVPSPGQLTGTVDDLGGSGIDEVQIAIRDITNGQWVDGDGNTNGGYQRFPTTLTNQTTATADWEFDIDLPAATYRVYVRGVDNAGNVGAWTNLKFTVQ